MNVKNEKGSALIILSIILLGIITVAGGSLYTINLADKTRLEKIEDVQKAIYLAEKGLSYAYTEVREHALKWYTHNLLPNNRLKALPSASVPDPVVEGAKIDTNGDYLPFGDDSVRVRVYKDNDNHIWAVAKVKYKGVTKVLRASMIVGSLLEFFQFYTKWHSFSGSYKVDGKGFGKIYINGSARFDGQATFKNIALLSTNSTGTFYVNTSNKEPPYYWDDKSGKHIDGLAFLPMRDNEFYSGFTVSNRDYYYGITWDAPDVGDVFTGVFSTTGAYDPIRYFQQKAKSCSAAPKFVFEQSVMGDKLDLNGADAVTIYMPNRIYDENGSPINYKFDIYKGEDADTVGEKPVKFVRLYKKVVDPDGSERWVITSDVEQADFAQVFDMKDSKAEGMDKVSMVYKKDGNYYTKEIPVKEDGITITSYEVSYTTVCDADGTNCYKQITNVIPHQKTYDVNEEKVWWASKYPSQITLNTDGSVTITDSKIEDYIENGFTRNDAEYKTFGYPEYDGFNALNTGYYEHAEKFKEWLEGKYKPSGADPNLVHEGIDLSNIIKEGSTGAVTLDPVEIKDTLSDQAKSAGLWIGYEKDDEGVEQLTVYINGEKKYQGEDNLPPWLSLEEFTTGNYFWYDGWNKNTKYKYSVKKAKVLTIDFSKLAQKVSGKSVLDQINGVVWVDYRLGSETNYNHPNNNKYNKAVKIVNAEEIKRDGGVTIVSPQSIMIQGDFNYQQGSTQQNYQPCAIITDGDVYVLSKDFTPPDYTPSFASVIKPYRDARNYLKDVLGSDYWPNPDTDCVGLSPDACVAKLKTKLQKIEDALIDFYDNKLSDDLRKYGAPADAQLKLLAESIDLNNKNPDQINKLLENWFKVAHAPTTTVVVPIFDDQGNITGYERVAATFVNENLAPGMVMVKDDPDNRQVYINAAIVSGEYRGDAIRYIENWSWFGSDYVNPAYLRIEGMFPHVMNKSNPHVPDNRWSNLYSRYVFSGSIHPGASPIYVAHDYSQESPPGDLSYVGLSIYYVEKDPDMFDRHPVN